MGNLIPRKGLHTLLAALALLPREDWRLTVVGSLEMDPPYVAGIRRQIAALGLTAGDPCWDPSPEELAARLRGSHLLAVPSSYEGFGIVYLEAMHFGLPVIAGHRRRGPGDRHPRGTAFWCRRGMPRPGPSLGP